MNSADADRQIEQMIAFIAQEAKEKAEEIQVKTEKEFMADKLSLETQLRSVAQPTSGRSTLPAHKDSGTVLQQRELRDVDNAFAALISSMHSFLPRCVPPPLRPLCCPTYADSSFGAASIASAVVPCSDTLDAVSASVRVHALVWPSATTARRTRRISSSRRECQRTAHCPPADVDHSHPTRNAAFRSAAVDSMCTCLIVLFACVVRVFTVRRVRT